MTKKQILKQTQKFAQEKLSGDGSGHDWWHVYRVWKSAVKIGKREKADMFVVELAALLHDIADWKFNNGDENAGPKVAREWLEKLQVNETVIKHVCEIIQHLSFKGAGVKSKITTKEGMVVQDADRLDALGAIGIARTFAYGGSTNREMHNPAIRPQKHKTFEQYKNSVGTTVNHFYEKLLLLKGLMNTKTAKKMAANRHKFMEKYLDEFYEEWNGKK